MQFELRSALTSVAVMAALLAVARWAGLLAALALSGLVLLVISRRVVTWSRLLAVTLATCLIAPSVGFFFLTGSFFPLRIIESLDRPMGVLTWDEEGILLLDGDKVTLPGITRLPVGSSALSESIKRGIEISDDGRVYALVRIDHWCGNHPVREHIARVDLAKMLIFLAEAEPRLSFVREHQGKPSGPVSGRGWDIGDYGRFRRWEEKLKECGTDPSRPIEWLGGRSPRSRWLAAMALRFQGCSIDASQVMGALNSEEREVLGSGGGYGCEQRQDTGLPIGQ